MSKLPTFPPPITSTPSAPGIMPTFENRLGTFTVDDPARYHDRHPVEPPSQIVAAAPQVEPIDPATPELHYGGIAYDREYRRPTHEWNSLQEFHTWRINEELDHGIELLLSSTRRSDGPLWGEYTRYSCSRQGSGGKKIYVRKCMDRKWKQPSKRTGCRCKLRIKTYCYVNTVLGWYEPKHDHAIGVANLMYTRLRDSTRNYVMDLLRINMSPKEVFTRVRSEHGRNERGHYITMQDIYRLRTTLRQQEAARSMSSDADQPNYEHSEGSPIKEEEEEEPTIPPDDASGTRSTAEVDEDLDVLDEQSDGEADPGILSSPPPGSDIPHLYTAGAAADMEFAASPVVPAASMGSTLSPASSVAPAISPVVPAASMEPTPLPVVPASHYIAPPPPPPPPPVHNMPSPWYMPPPLVVYLPYPPYQMTLYPLYPVYIPPPTS